MKTTRVVLVGGFLGAGKTTLIAQATQRLMQQGKRVGLITNDQAANLVDTAVLEAVGSPVCEVAGGCFCCRFDDLVSAMDRLVQEQDPDVLIGEPVGSCTDLSATVLQPMKDLYRDRFRTAPFSVLVDVKQVRTLERLRAALDGQDAARFPDNVMYIYQKQLEEADVIVLNKADLLSAVELAKVRDTLKREFTTAPVIVTSALNGQGVDAWLDFILHETPTGRTITAVDYDEYAAGEAALGWLNTAAHAQSDRAVDWKSFCVDLVAGLQRDLQEVAAEVAHLKVHMTIGHESLVVNLTSNDGTPMARGQIDAAARQGRLLLNARAHIAPEQLRAIVERRLQAVSCDGVRLTVEDLQAFAPGRPEPKHRYGAVVE